MLYLLIVLSIWSTVLPKVDWKLKETRIQAGYTQAQLGELLKVSRSTISRWERTGEIKFKEAVLFMEKCKAQMQIIFVKEENTTINPEVCFWCPRHSCSLENAIEGRPVVMKFPELTKDCPFYLEHVISVKQTDM